LLPEIASVCLSCAGLERLCWVDILLGVEDGRVWGFLWMTGKNGNRNSVVAGGTVVVEERISPLRGLR
jgi:hypothetical protein